MLIHLYFKSVNFPALDPCSRTNVYKVTVHACTIMAGVMPWPGVASKHMWLQATGMALKQAVTVVITPHVCHAHLVCMPALKISG